MSDELITDIPTIQRLSEENDDENWRFRSYLKSHPRLNISRLERTVKEETEWVWSQIDCTKCANCCKIMKAEVKPADIKRLAQHMGISVKEFVANYCEDSEYGEKQLKSLPCMFLGDDNRCTVYDIRPKICQEYPFLYKKGFLQRTMGVISNTDVCPIVFNVWENLKGVFWRRRRR